MNHKGGHSGGDCPSQPTGAVSEATEAAQNRSRTPNVTIFVFIIKRLQRVPQVFLKKLF
jgi:hypothetical protein